MSGFRWTPEEVGQALGVGASGAEVGEHFSGVSTDTRSIGDGDLFVALSGERFDAHDFLGRAAEAGAAGAVVSRVPENAPPDLAYYVVPDPLTALGRLARHRRMSLGATVIGITGTNGKTTTKELLRAALAPRFRVHATEGNLNNQIGVPLTLLAAPDEADVLVVEMGMNEPGEIAILATIARPSVGVITGVSAGHLEKVGSVHGVLIEKTSLLACLPADGLAVVADDPAELPRRAASLVAPGRLQVCGLNADGSQAPDGGIEAIDVRDDGSTVWSWRGHRIHLSVPGRHNVRNAVLALTVASRLGVPEGEAAEAVSRMPAPSLRGEWKRIGGMRVIADCYNANPASLRAAVDLLATVPADGRKVAVVGTMRELGEHEAALHEEAARAAAGYLDSGIDLIVGTGAFVQAFQAAGIRDSRIVLQADPVEAYHVVERRLTGDETLLLKASRGEALERWIPLLEGRWGE